MRSRSFTLWMYAIGLTLAVFYAGPAHAQLVFTATYDDAALTAAGYNLNDVHTEFTAALHQMEHQFVDPVHVNIMLTTMPDGFGASTFGVVPGFTYQQVRQALIDDQNAAPSPTGATSLASLSDTDPTNGGTFILSRAQAKALKLMPDDMLNDGTIRIATNVNWTFDQNNRNAPNTYDFISTAVHEASEVMGRFDGITGNPGEYSINDLFRYSAPGVRDLMNDRKGYLSIDGGVTNLATFDSSGDLEDYAFNNNNPAEPFGPQVAGTPGDLSMTGSFNMDVLGWDWPPHPQAVPEPGAAALLASLGAVGGMLGIRSLRRRKKA